mmetsp:Transcript_4628/g.7701  ORF Transcript_4628/g.7701 Transcript_4628/m.7701 type:complete len:231 (-) Transcript_4628:744-1436(-)
MKIPGGEQRLIRRVSGTYSTPRGEAVRAPALPRPGRARLVRQARLWWSGEPGETANAPSRADPDGTTPRAMGAPCAGTAWAPGDHAACESGAQMKGCEERPCSDEGVHEVLEIEEVPNLLVVLLDRGGLRRLELALGVPEPAEGRRVPANHDRLVEDARGREQRRRDRRRVVEREHERRARRDLGGAEAGGKGLDPAGTVAVHVGEILRDGDHGGVDRHEAGEEGHRGRP